MKRETIGEVRGRPVDRVVLENERLSAVILSFGGVLQSLWVKDPVLGRRDVVLGFARLEDYVDQGYYVGAVIGRCANRIRGASFTIDGGAGDPFPLRGPALEIEYLAAGTRDTVVNLTHHSYFNLEKDHAGDITGERLTLFADAVTEIDESCSCTGGIFSVEGTPFDFRQGARIGERIFSEDAQMQKGSGLNHNYVLSKPLGAFGPVAEVVSSDGLLSMRVESDQPGVQVYGGNYLDGSLTGKNGESYRRFAGLCLETQDYPDAVHWAHFPSTLLKSGRLYQRRTRYSFAGVKRPAPDCES